MKRKKEQTLKEKKPFSDKRMVILSIILVAMISLGFLLIRSFLQTPENKFSLKAAIIDQLGGDIENPDFNETGTVASTLKNAGFNVSYHRSETINVAFYKELAKYDYGVIMLRSHSAMREGETVVDIFTNEEYNENTHVSEQENGLLTKGYYSWKPGFYFAITPKFIESLEGSFPKSLVIAMGCHTMNETCTEMAEAFIRKGAKIFIGWTGLVRYSHTDNETVKLLERFIGENMRLDNAISAVNYDSYFGSTMKYYPPDTGSFRISDLIMEAKVSANVQITTNSFKLLPIFASSMTRCKPKFLDMSWSRLAC